MLELLITVLAAAGQPAPARDEAPVPLGWRGKTHTTRALPKELDAPCLKAIEAWTVWAREHDYRFDLDADARVLLVSSDKGGNPAKRLELVARTAAWFDSILPLPPAAPADPAAPAASPAGFAADAAPAVMLVLRDERDRASVLEALAAAHPYLADWARSTGQQLGFVLEDPLCGAYVEKAAGQKEWSPNHELVHRVAELLTLRRFGRAPFWIAQGLGWEAEMAFDENVYCFPYRTEFVYAAEHGSWPVLLRNESKDRGDKPLGLQEVAGWPRGRFEPGPAHLAWGLVHVAATRANPRFSMALQELRAFRDEHDRRSTGPNTWERMPGYEIPAADQERILLAHLGSDYLTVAGEWCRKPSATPDGAVKRP